MIQKVNKFVTEVIVELKKVSWSTKRELLESTWIVLLSSAFLGIFIGTTDLLLSKIIGYLIK
jgi:preprotein translocase subunit SecE